MSIEQRVAAIAAMSAVERKAKWHRRMGTVAPAAFGSGLLARALAHELQIKALGGGLTKAELKRLAQLNRKDDRVRDGAATGWLPHTTRAALTGLKKKGHAVTSTKTDGARTYRLTTTNDAEVTPSAAIEANA